MTIFGIKIKSKNPLLLFICEIIKRYIENKISYISGSMAYFFTLSLFPFILFISSLLATLSIDASSISSFLSPFFPAEIISIISGYTTYISSAANGYTLAFSAIICLISASQASNSLMISINSIYKTKNQCSFISEIFLSATFTLLVAIIIFLFIVLVIAGSKFFKKLYLLLNLSQISVNVLSFLVVVSSLALIFFILLLLYFFMPSKKTKAKNLIWGSLFSTISIAIISLAIRIYISISSHFSLLYGSISAIITVMLWFYLFANIILIGADINRIYEINIRKKA